MLRKLFSLFFAFVLLVPAANVGAATAVPVPVFKDLQGHWSKEYVDYLAELGVYNGYKNEFKPDAPISRGEALMLINRVFKATFGTFADPLATTRIDSKHWAAAEAKELFGNLNSMFYSDQRMYIKYNPSENLLYYLHLSATGKKMKSTEKTWPTWSVTAAHLSQPLSREEASMIFFHVLSPYIAKSFNVQPLKVEGRFDSFYSWKQPTNYLDNPSPYATALQEYAIYTPNQKKLEPAKKMTRGEFAVTLKRLHETYVRKNLQQLAVDKLNFFLTAATHAYYKQDQALMKNYFQPGALKILQDAAAQANSKRVALHDYSGRVYIIEKNTFDWKVQAFYKENQVGAYEVVYYLKLNPGSNNPYGMEISSIDYNQK